MKRIVEFNDVHRAYAKGEPVLDGIGFTVDAGEVIGLLGKNGAGKTTLLHLAMGMLEPQAGRVRIFGLDPRREPVEVKRRVGFVSEDQVLPTFFTVERILEVHRGLYSTWDEDLARELLGRFDLPLRRKAGKLSKGQARQLALLCAVAHRPELLILDEPAGGLDPHARREFLETSIRLLNETGTTILFSSHHMTDVERMASRLLMLHEGQIWIDSDLDDIREGYCLALLPVGFAEARSRLLAEPACLCVRESGDAVRAIFEMGSETCAVRLRESLDLADVTCRPLPLEEMFVELVGGTS